MDLDLTCLHIQGERSGRAEQHRGDNELHLLLLGFSKRCGLKRGSNKVGGEYNCHKDTTARGRPDLVPMMLVMAASPLVADLDDVRSQQLVT